MLVHKYGTQQSTTRGVCTSTAIRTLICPAGGTYSSIALRVAASGSGTGSPSSRTTSGDGGFGKRPNT